MVSHFRLAHAFVCRNGRVTSPGHDIVTHETPSLPPLTVSQPSYPPLLALVIHSTQGFSPHHPPLPRHTNPRAVGRQRVAFVPRVVDALEVLGIPAQDSAEAAALVVGPEAPAARVVVLGWDAHLLLGAGRVADGATGCAGRTTGNGFRSGEEKAEDGGGCETHFGEQLVPDEEKLGTIGWAR